MRKPSSVSLCFVMAFNFVLFASLAQSPLGGIPLVRNFHTVDYHAGIQNWDITQDKRGLIYIANNFGLLEFDGTNWDIYRVRNGTKVRSVAIDARGRVYVGCQGDFGYFFPDQRGRLTYVSLADSLNADQRNFDETWSVYLDGQKVYFCTFSAIYTYDGKKFSISKAPVPLELSFLVNRQLYVTTRANGISLLANNELNPFNGGAFFQNISISSIIALHPDELLISTFQHGIFVVSQGSVKPWIPKHQDLFKDSNINCLLRLRNGNFAAGTQNDGMFILSADGEIITHLTTGKGLANRTVLSVYEDDLNNLWVGQNNGIAYIELGSPFTFVNEQSGLPGTGYTAYLDNTKLYAGTNTGVYVKDATSEGDYQLVANTRGQVYHLGKYNGSLLAGHHNGAMMIDGLRATPISTDPGAWIFMPLQENSAQLIGGTYTGLVLYEKKDNRLLYKKKLTNFNESSRVMAQDHAGYFWMTHGYKGAFKISLNDDRDSVNNVELYDYRKGFPSNNLINVFRVRNDLLFTSEAGIFRYDETADLFVKDKFFSKTLGENVQLWSIQEDAMENIYFIGSESIGVLKKNKLDQYEIETNSFNKIRKYLNDDLVNISVLKNNEVLFGAKDGFIHYNPKVDVSKNPGFFTLIRNVTTTHEKDSVLFYGNYIENDTIVYNQISDYRPKLEYKSNSISFSFTATSYEGDETLFQFYLENYEKDWSAWTTKTQKEYTNLKEGKYIFHVRAKNVNGIVSPETSYEFSVKPPWYRSIWAYSLYGVSVIALLFCAFVLLDRKYQREQQLMALKQKKELNKKQNELTQLTLQSQEEINRLQHEKLESELRHMNSELGTSTMHLLNKNEFITGVKTNLTHIIKKSSNDEVKKELLQITKDIENNISADSDWEQFQYHFDRVHGDFSTRFKVAFPALSPQEIKLSAYLRMNLSSKEIAQLLNISIRGVEISRYRLRKKLHLERNTNLQDFILNF
jgi:DNA-binding CsgD family transcriptional regulator